MNQQKKKPYKKVSKLEMEAEKANTRLLFEKSLEENPELYYKILPYAQVLGVTDEWEKKFENILIQPPTWCTGTDMDLFDIWLLNRCMRSAFVIAMARSQPKGGGGFIGGSGGGGHFGGFGGGGFGGGGGGAR